jgi:hypothetical protein
MPSEVSNVLLDISNSLKLADIITDAMTQPGVHRNIYSLVFSFSHASESKLKMCGIKAVFAYVMF